MDNLNSILIDPMFLQGEDSSRMHCLKLLLTGHSNNSIAEELSFSVKNIEAIIAKFMRKAQIVKKGINRSIINPRVRLMIHGLENNWLQFDVEPADFTTQLSLSNNQYTTLVLCALGLSNIGISEFLYVSRKTTESRLNTLFTAFSVNTTDNKLINPRFTLINRAIFRGLVNQDHLIEIAKTFDIGEWESLKANREQIINNINSYYLNKSLNMSNNMNMADILQKVQLLNQEQNVYNFNPDNNFMN